MTLVLLGLNHRTAPVEVRERYSIAPDQLEGLAEKFAAHPEVAEAALIATCNRTEVVVSARDLEQARLALADGFHRRIGDGSAGGEQTFELVGEGVVRHLFRVASSLDSMVVGEAQILGQLKDAYRSAVRAHSCGPVLNRLFQRAFRAAKRVRTETGLGASPVSVARVGVQLAGQIFESFEGKRVLLLGAGEMAESALRGLRDSGARDFTVVNRTVAAARRLAERFGGRAAGLEDLEREIGSADVASCSIAVDRPVLGRELLARALAERHGLPILLVDLGVPRNVDPGVNELRNVYVYDLDDIEAQAERGRERRGAAVPQAERIVSAEVDAFERWRAALPLVPTIRELRERVQQQIEQDLARATRLDASERRRSAEAMTAKILHRPLDRLRREAEEGAGPYYAEAVRSLFGLEEEEEES
ncbi:MAG: glutamyl-tRNA reductase [Proteobacteria bacterium]|nr:glutamyl-tRNA reductase [Pseudomonadota bacterium]